MIPNPNPAGSDANISQIPKFVMSDRHPEGMGLTSVPQSLIRQKPLPHSITGVTKDVIASLLVFDSTIIISPPIIPTIPPKRKENLNFGLMRDTLHEILSSPPSNRPLPSVLPPTHFFLANCIHYRII